MIAHRRGQRSVFKQIFIPFAMTLDELLPNTRLARLGFVSTGLQGCRSHAESGEVYSHRPLRISHWPTGQPLKAVHKSGRFGECSYSGLLCVCVNDLIDRGAVAVDVNSNNRDPGNK